MSGAAARAEASEKAWFLDSDVGERFPAWTRGNAADVFPEPVSPLAQTLYIRPGLAAGLRDADISMGMLDWDEFEDPENPDLFKVFGGYLYNALSLVRVFGARMPGATPEAIDNAFFDSRDQVPPYIAEPWHDSPRHAAMLAETMQWAMSTTSIPELDVQKALAEQIRDSRPDLPQLTDAHLIARARSLVPVLQYMFDTGMVASTVSSLGPGVLQAISAELGDPSIAIRLLAGIEVDSAAPSHAMWALATTVRSSSVLTSVFDAGLDGALDRVRELEHIDAKEFLDEFDAFIHSFGSRGANEWDVIAPTWEVRPETALSAIDLMRRSDESNAPVGRRSASVAERDRLVGEVRALLEGNDEARATFEAALQSAQVFLSGRERYKTNCIIVVGEIRMCLREVARRMVDRGALDCVEQFFMATNSELDAIRQRPGDFRDVLADRWTQYQVLRTLEPPFVVNGIAPSRSDLTPRSTDAAQAASGEVLTGAAGSGGTARGRARIVHHPENLGNLEPGDVLVAPQTDPSWVPLFLAASAVVVNVGALGSHAMIVSRELGIPCVVSVVDATDRIPDGAMITVDGTAGTVTLD